MYFHKKIGVKQQKIEKGFTEVNQYHAAAHKRFQNELEFKTLSLCFFQAYFENGVKKILRFRKFYRALYQNEHLQHGSKNFLCKTFTV